MSNFTGENTKWNYSWFSKCLRWLWLPCKRLGNKCHFSQKSKSSFEKEESYASANGKVCAAASYAWTYQDLWIDASDQDQIQLLTCLLQFLNFLFILLSRYLYLRKMVSLDFMAIFYVVLCRNLGISNVMAVAAGLFSSLFLHCQVIENPLKNQVQMKLALFAGQWLLR